MYLKANLNFNPPFLSLPVGITPVTIFDKILFGYLVRVFMEVVNI
jgi:hypothetical protein